MKGIFTEIRKPLRVSAGPWSASKFLKQLNATFLLAVVRVLDLDPGRTARVVNAVPMLGKDPRW